MPQKHKDSQHTTFSALELFLFCFLLTGNGIPHWVSTQRCHCPSVWYLSQGGITVHHLPCVAASIVRFRAHVQQIWHKTFGPYGAYSPPCCTFAEQEHYSNPASRWKKEGRGSLEGGYPWHPWHVVVTQWPLFQQFRPSYATLMLYFMAVSTFGSRII